MTDTPPLGSAPQLPQTCRLLEGSGICADYRKKIDELFIKEREAAAKSDLVSKASSVAVKAALAVAATAIAGLGSLSGYLWYRFVNLDEAMTGAAKYSGVPVGTVLAWTGEIPPWPKDPEGKDRDPKVGDWHFYWRECDGREIPLEKHKDLNAVIGSTYGKAENGNVKLPDYRGLFLRGLLGNRPSGKQPIGDREFQFDADAGKRLSPVDWKEVVGNKVGTVQFDTSAPNAGQGMPGEWWVASGVNTSGSINGLLMLKDVDHREKVHTINHGSIETRPKNIAVHWIIRVR